MPISKGRTQMAAKRKLISPVKETTTKRQRKAFCNLTNYAGATRLKEKADLVKQKRVSDGIVEESEESLYVTALDSLPDDSQTSLPSTIVQNHKKPSAIPITKPYTRLSAKLNAENKPCSQKNDENELLKDIKTRFSSKIDIIVEKPVARRTIKSTIISDDNILTEKNEVRASTSSTISINSSTTKCLVPDFDKECLGDVNQVSEYANDIFLYMKEREVYFRPKPYLDDQTTMTKRHRAQLVDILVQLQEHLELTHETLYLAVYLFDNYLSKGCAKGGWDVLNDLKRQWKNWRLYAIASMLLACKYEERCAPHLDEFVYCVSGTISGIIRGRLLRAESVVWRACKYEMGVPLSYRFLRRYARCVYTPMDILTLARYILELSLLDYDITVGLGLSISRLAAAALWLARRMYFQHKRTKTEVIWTATLQHYSGYEEDHLIELICKLNALLHNQKQLITDDDDELATIKNKYSHRVFYKVAELPLIPNEILIIQ